MVEPDRVVGGQQRDRDEKKKPHKGDDNAAQNVPSREFW
jgi:hypothetical protein